MGRGNWTRLKIFVLGKGLGRVKRGLGTVLKS